MFRFCFSVLTVCCILMFSLSAQAAGRLENVHMGQGVNCQGCHVEAPPVQAVPSDKCEGCHGNHDKVAEKTEDIHPNPHFSHAEPFACTECHHVHKASEIKCNECHVYEFERGR